MWHQNSPLISGTASPGDSFGSALASGDYNCDGRADLAIGVPGEARGSTLESGVVHVLEGGPGGLTGVGSVKLSQASPGVAGSPEWGDSFGAALAVGDFNGNGRVDLAVGVRDLFILDFTGWQDDGPFEHSIGKLWEALRRQDEAVEVE